MGTSLSGLTPATTFDGLLKTSDNDAITSSLKTIGSGDGTDSCLQLSDSALKVNSGSVTIVGTGATSATTSLLVQNSAGDNMFKTTDDGNTTLKSFGASNVLILDTVGGVCGFQMNSSNGQQRFRIQGTSTATRFTPNNTNDAFTFVGNGIYTSGAFDIPSARLHIKGSGNDNTTTSLLVQNSDASDLFSVRDDGKVNIDNDVYIQGAIYGGSNTKLRVGTDLNIASTRAWIKGLGATSATTSLLVQNSANNIFSVRDDGALLFYRATNGAELLRIEDTGSSPRFVAGNNAGKSLTLGNDTITSAFSSIQFKTYDGVSYSEAMRITGNTDQFVGIGETIPTAKLHVKGAGNTGATSSLLIQNSSASDLLRVNDSGEIRMQSLDFLGNKITSLARISTSGLAINNAGTSPDANTQLHVKGSGATSATTSLLVENSAGTEHLKITDDGIGKCSSKRYCKSRNKLFKVVKAWLGFCVRN